MNHVSDVQVICIEEDVNAERKEMEKGKDGKGGEKYNMEKYCNAEKKEMEERK